MTALKPLIPAALYDELAALFTRLSEPFVWDLLNGKKKLAVLEEAVPEVLAMREKLMGQIEDKLERRK